MEKMLKKIKIFVLILMIILISVISFVGIFKKEKGVWNNLLPDYKYGMDIEGARELKYIVDSSEEEKTVYVDENGNIKGEVWENGSPITEEHEHDHEEEKIEEVQFAQEKRMIKSNPDEKLTKENFELTKSIIQKRFKEQGINEFNIRMDNVTGNLVIETTNNNDNVELVKNLVTQVGKFEIIDYQNGLVLMDNSDIENVTVVSSNESNYKTYLQIDFNKAGSEKLREISKKYVEVKKEESEEENAEDTESEIKYVSIVFDDTTMLTTYFGEEMTNGILQMTVGQERTDYDEFLEDYELAKTIADVLNTGVLPVEYELESDNFVKSDITDEDIKILKIAGAVALLIATLIFIVKFKKKGLLGSIFAIGFVALFSLVIRYTNVVLTVNSLIACWIVIIINYAFTKMILNKLKTMKISQAYNEVAKQFYLSLIPVIVIAVVFTLTNSIQISSIGMVMFWGIIINVLYNLILAKIAKRVF